MRCVLSCRFNVGERAPGTHWIGDWVGPRAGLGQGGEEKPIPAPVGNRTTVIYPVA
jgi:hypothetical protein